MLKRIDRDEVRKGHAADSTVHGALNLSEILKRQEGFETLMRFLVKEFSC